MNKNLMNGQPVKLHEVMESLNQTDRTLFLHEFAAYEKYKTTAGALEVINQLGREQAAKLSTEEFLAKVAEITKK